MTAISKIQWTDHTWNPVRGCSVISPGCVNCYAMKQAHRFSGPGKAYDGLTKLTKAGPQWTGNIRTVDDALLKPLSWRKPQRVFVNSMSDLFHEGVPFEFVDRVFAVMSLASRHTFQILTKRPVRMKNYVNTGNRAELVAMERHRIQQFIEAYWSKSQLLAGYARPSAEWDALDGAWPLPNVWLGASVEDLDRLERADEVKDARAAVHFLSIEPLLEDLGALILDGIEWVIVGGESGPNARPCPVAWIHSVVRECRRAEVPVFVKQLGSKPTNGIHCDDETESYAIRMLLADRKGGDPSEWPVDLRVREFPNVQREADLHA